MRHVSANHCYQMLDAYVATTNDNSILERALPLAEKELAWWKSNRTITVTSPYTNQTHNVTHYAVVNTAPRPESYYQGGFMHYRTTAPCGIDSLRFRLHDCSRPYVADID